MKCTLPILSLIFLSTFVYGQNSRSAPQRRLYGKIVDASTNRGLDAASVQLLVRRFDPSGQPGKDTVIDGMLTGRNGDFDLENIPGNTNLVFIATAIGFQTFELRIPAPLGASDNDKDLGNIKLKVDPKLLQNVTVTATKPLMSLGIDRKVFNVEKNLASVGGTAEDVMRNVPSISVDLDGNVTLRNSAPQIFVDGRPTTMTLEQIPADAIESVEIITNPSAKFDASGGTAGILNIVLKKNRRTGYNGTLRAGIDQRGRYSYGADLNLRQNKINFFANINSRQRKSISNGKTDRLTNLDPANTQLFQQDRNIRENSNLFGRAGFDYLIDNRNTLTVSGYMSNGNFDSDSKNDLYVDTLYTAIKSSYSRRLSVSEGNYRNNGASIGFKHLFAKAGKEWTADVNYNGSSNKNDNSIATSSYNVIGGPLSKQFDQLITGNGTNNQLTIQADYSDPITKNSKLEFGGRVQIRNVDNQNVINYMNASGNYYKIPQLSSDYKNRDNVYAGYLSFSNKINKFGYQLGLRMESSEYSGTVRTAAASSGKDTMITYGNNFPFSLFPSIFLTQDIGHNQEMQFNVTRRINRPNFWQLFPFTDYSDSLNLSRGNPNLKPEFTYSAELAYQKTFPGNNTFLASLYLKYTDQLITRFQEKEINPVNGADNLINSYINANASYIGGLELIDRQKLFAWWELTSNLNIYGSKIDIGDPTVTNQGTIFSYFVKVNNTFKLSNHFSLQVSADYRSKTVLPAGGGGGRGGGGGGGGWGQPQATAQGYIRPQGELEAGIRYDFLKEKKASLTLNVSDIFRTDASNVYSESAYFVQNTYRLRDPQFFRINFSWRFGKFDTNLFKRRNNKEVNTEEEN